MNPFVRVIDVETTGTDPTKDAVVEIAWLDVDLATGEISNVFDTLIRPGMPIPPEAMAIHHITGEMVVDAPLLAQVLPALHAPEPGQPVAYVAHNAAYESAFLHGVGPWICTYKCALRVWFDAPGHSNQVLRYWRGLHDCVPSHLTLPHRALYDAYVTAAIFKDMWKLARSTDPIQSMIAVSAQLARHPTCPIGKHRGQPWEKVPTGFLQWMTKQGDMDPALVESALIEIERRHNMADDSATRTSNG